MSAYLSTPDLWGKFYKNMSRKTFNPYKFRKQKKIQTGRGLYGRYRGSYLIPVNPNAIDTDVEKTKNTVISPVEAVAERAKSELKSEKQQKKPHVKVLKAIKRRKIKNRTRKKKISNKSTSQRKRQSKSRKRKLINAHKDSVWNQPSVKKKRKL